MSLVKEFWDFIIVRKKFMLAPVIAVLVIMSGLLVLAASSPALSSVIYTLF